MNEPITTGQVVAEVRKLAAERPDFVYTRQAGYRQGLGCSYIGANPERPGEGEGCVVGQALTRLGVERDWLEGVEELAGVNVATVLHRMKLEGLLDRIEERDLSWLHFAQKAQDFGFPWGDAVRRADEREAIL